MPTFTKLEEPEVAKIVELEDVVTPDSKKKGGKRGPRKIASLATVQGQMEKALQDGDEVLATLDKTISWLKSKLEEKEKARKETVESMREFKRTINILKNGKKENK
jgi:hypothetical protein